MNELTLILLPVLFAAPLLVGFAYTAWYAAKELAHWYHQHDLRKV